MQPLISAYAIPGFKDESGTTAPKTFKEAYILYSVAEYFNISIEDLTGYNRYRQFVYPRHTAKYLLKKYTALSLNQIGSHFKSRRRIFSQHQDHTTVLHSIKLVTYWYDTKDHMANHVTAIINKYL